MAEPVTRFFPTFYDSPAGRIAILTMDNGHDHQRPNTFSEAALHSLEEALEQVDRQKDVKGLLLTGKPYIFAAGADLTEVPFITTYEQGYQVGRLGHTIMKRIMDLPFPTVAAINGVALGGGLEIALYCRHRTVHRSVSAIGFPECFLGLIPGWGGCTLTTKLLGPEKAIQLIVTNPLNQNRLIGGPAAYEMGLADRLFDAAEFLDDSLRYLMDLMAGTAVEERPPAAGGDVRQLVAKARSFVDSRIHGAAPAPYRALELIEGACEWDLERGFEEENKALGDLIKSRQCKASIYSFDLVNRYAKKRNVLPDVKPRAVGKIGIVGAGLMASQLAQLFAYRLEIPVVMKDLRQDLIDRGCGFVAGEFRKMVEKGRLSEGKGRYLTGLVRGTLDVRDLADCDLVIEAVFERMDVKRQVFGEVESVIGRDTLLATNTSSLSVTEMAQGLAHPERLVGLHFFNPVAVMPLVEIVKAAKTGEEALATAFDLSRKLKKTAVLVKDSPAFLVNRVLVRMLVDCLSLADEGASFEEIDAALLALGLPMAPFQLLDLVGLPVAYHVTETLCRAFGPERFPLNANLRRLIESGVTAFYVREGNVRKIDPQVEAAWERQGQGQFHPEEIQERVLANLARETDLILRERVVESSRDVDLAMILGAGWPFFMGGLTMYLDLVGITPKVLQKVFFSF